MIHTRWSKVVHSLIALSAAAVLGAAGRVPVSGTRPGGSQPQRPARLVKPAPKVNSKATVWKAPTPPRNPAAGDVWVNPTDGMEMVYIAPGEFILGTGDAQIAAWTKQYPDQKRQLFIDEQPQCRVNLPGYWIGRTEVTNAQYQRFVRATGHRPPGNWKGKQMPSGLKNLPVVFVTWQDARAYCEWAKGRLPTESQWEKAARGTDGRVFPWGNQWDKSRCSNGYSSTAFGPAAVGSYRSDFSPYGCFDVAGNVSEWCADWYDARAYARYAKRNLNPPKSGQAKVLRGGSWSGRYPRDFRCAFRDSLDPADRYDSIGFRCARSAAP